MTKNLEGGGGMEKRVSGCRGCLLGLAVGDAMGHTVDEKSWEEIRQDYGPNGLLGYDLVNGCASASAYTQVASYVSNGLLLGVTRGKPELYLRYIVLSLREWARAQHFPRDPEKSWCWVAKIPQMRVRKCKDSRMLDALRMDPPGAMDKPVNRASSTGSLPGAVVVGLACNNRGMDRALAPKLGAQTVALTHGNVETFLCGSVLAECIASILDDPEKSLKEQFNHAIEVMEAEFGSLYGQAGELADLLHSVMEKAEKGSLDSREAMEGFACNTAPECLAGALYACMCCPDDFDGAMILAVNHSGRSAAVGSLVGAILGAHMGAEALPEFYLECLEPAEILETLAADLALCSPTIGLFDDDWDHKYVQGLPMGVDA